MELLFNTTTKVFSGLKIFVPAVFLAFLIQYVSAANWVPPTNLPISPNVSAPINVSSVAQTKLGGLTIGDGLTANDTSLLVVNGKVGIGVSPSQKLDVGGAENGEVRASQGFCIGDSAHEVCISSWPSPGGTFNAGVTGVTEGDNIDLTSSNGEVTIINAGASTVIPGAVMVKLFCIANNPSSPDVCPSTWTSAGVFDNGGHSWCESTSGPTSGTFIDHTGDAVLCYK